MQQPINTHVYRGSSNVAGSSTQPASPTGRPGQAFNYQAKNGRTRQANNNASQYRKAHSVSPPSCFATSQFQSPPSARQIPLPPTNWLNKANDETSRPPSSSSSVTSESSSSSSESFAMTGAQLFGPPMNNQEVSGFRMNPLNLIAAVATA